MNSLWSWYWAAIKKPAAIGTDALPIHENDPQVGYYRMKRAAGKGPWEPVYIFAHGADLQARIGPYQTGDLVPAVEIWKWCCRYPIHHSQIEGRPETAVNYTDAAVNGKPWPDSVFAMVERKPDPAPVAETEGPDPEPGIGHNSGESAEDILAKLTEDAGRMLAAAEADLKKLGAVSLDTWAKSDADRIANRATEIGAIEKLISAARDNEVGPLHAAWQAAVGKWRPLQTSVDTTKKTLTRAANDWAKAAQRKADEEARERAAAEAARLAAERAKLSTETQELLPPEPAPVVQAERVMVGTVGKRTGAKISTRYVIDDRAAAVAFIFKMIEDPKEPAILMEALQTVVNRIAGAGTTVPGVRKVVE